MTPWNAAQNDPEFFAYLQSNGWTESEYNKTEGWERTDVRVEFNGGLMKTGILRELPGAVVETVKEQGAAVARAAGAANRTIQIIGAVVFVLCGAYLVMRFLPKPKAGK